MSRRVTPLEAFNRLAESVVVIDCCATRAQLVPGGVLLESQLCAAEASSAARQLALDMYMPDDPFFVILMDELLVGGDSNERDRVDEVAEWLLGEGCCRTVWRVDRALFADKYGFLMGRDFYIPYPQEILEDQLFLGSLAALETRQLGDLMITHVVTLLGRSVPCPPGLKHLWCKVEDSMEADLTAVMQQALPFIAEALAEGGRVLVHCEQGKSRSASVVVSYLCRERKLDCDAALALVRAQRPIAQPNPNFMQQLRFQRWEDAASCNGEARRGLSRSRTLLMAVLPALEEGIEDDQPEDFSGQQEAKSC